MFDGTSLTLHSDVDRDTEMFCLQKKITKISMNHLLVHIDQDITSSPKMTTIAHHGGSIMFGDTIIYDAQR